MITADDISELRKAGKSDDDILKDYREFDPQYNQDIDDLLKTGKKSGQILDDLAAFSADAPQVDPMDNKGILTKTKEAAQFGGASLLNGFGATAKAAGWQGTADALGNAAKTIAPPSDYVAAGSKFDITSPSTYGYAPRALLEGAPGVATDLAAGALGSVGGPAGAAGAFMASNAARNFGTNLEARMGNQAPGSAPSGADYLAAGSSTAAEALLSRVGINPAISSVAKGSGMKAVAQIPGLLAKATGAEAAGGAAGDLVNQVGRTAGTEGGLSIDPKELANSTALSGATGGTIRAGRALGDVTNAVKFRGIDDAAGARLVERLDRHGGDTSSPEAAYKTVDVARKTLDVEITDAAQVARPLFKSNGNDVDTDGSRVLLKDTITSLKAGADAPEGNISTLKDKIGGTQEGARLISLLEERQALNKVVNSGNFDKTSGTFAGGLADTNIGRNLLDPRAILRSKLGVGGSVAGVAGLSAAGQLAVMGPTIGKFLAAQGAAYGAARGADRALGLRDPAGEFMKRFRGDGDGPDVDLPSFRQDAADAGEASRVVDPIKLAKAKAKQEDRAWKAKDAQDKQAQKAEEARQADIERAYRGREDDPDARNAQEEALWAQQERSATQAANDDATASQGISEGYRALLERAVKAGEASRKLRETEEATKSTQVDKALKEKAKQDAEETKRQAEIDKAYEAQKSGKVPSEDDLWAAQEAKRAQESVEDLEAQAGIQSGYKALAAQAQAAVDARAKQADTGWKQKGQQDAQVEATKKVRSRDFSKAEAERSRPDPQRVKAAQEEAMWRELDGGVQPQDWSDGDAIAAIQREVQGRQKASDALTKVSAKQATEKTKAEAKAKPIPTVETPSEPLQIKVKPRAETTQETPVQQAAANAGDTQSDVIRVTHKGQEVLRPAENIRNPRAYMAKTLGRMETRQKFADDILKEVGTKQKQFVDALLGRLNNSAKTFDDAYSHVEDFVNRMPEKRQGKVYDIFNDYEGRLKSTYDN